MRNQPSGVERGRRRVRVVAVAGHHHRTRHQDLASGRAVSAFRELDVAPSIGTPSTTTPPHVSESPYASAMRAPARLGTRPQLVRQRRAAEHEDAVRVERRIGGEQPGEHRRDERHDGRADVGRCRRHRGDVEPRVHAQRCPGDVREPGSRARRRGAAARTRGRGRRARAPTGERTRGRSRSPRRW